MSEPFYCNIAKAYCYAERPHGEWIPCSERLPDKIGDYIVSNRYGDVYSTSLDYLWGEKCFGYDDDDGFFIEDNTVVAWMPLPKPYLEEGEQNESCN